MENSGGKGRTLIGSWGFDLGIADFFSKQLNLSKTQRESRTRIKVSIAAASFAVAASLVRFFLSSWVSVWVSRFQGVWVLFFVISGFLSERRSVASLVCFFCLRSLGLFFVVRFQGFWVFGFCSSWFGFCAS